MSAVWQIIEHDCGVGAEISFGSVTDDSVSERSAHGGENVDKSVLRKVTVQGDTENSFGAFGGDIEGCKGSGHELTALKYSHATGFELREKYSVVRSRSDSDRKRQIPSYKLGLNGSCSA